MSSLPDWMRPPRPEGWRADDLDHLPEAPRHTELIDGALVFRLLPQRLWHSHVSSELTSALTKQAPPGFEVAREMTLRLDEHNRPEPDLLVTTAAFEPNRTWFAPKEIRLAAEVTSPESAHRDRTVKLRKYAEAGIPHYWLVEDENGTPVVHVYELDEPTRQCAPVGVFRDELKLPLPFEITLDLGALALDARG
ncbi:Uma2 family endonuclease [Streptomyces sp. UNOC14_S4]|uniref:Uma2 family endonuclease n=1 Tax=Streptomyces sp. UNOC14_S4 TaxID=2872340 RepID=UPI001E287D61|nr:Uma2 family endonuclease [Streptomyces sp. UNOC14_S4]MCC3766978.1 Uma2 family endonuclease [Streptomyces sp. UNOC14_S4]